MDFRETAGFPEIGIIWKPAVPPESINHMILNGCIMFCDKELLHDGMTV